MSENMFADDGQVVIPPEMAAAICAAEDARLARARAVLIARSEVEQLEDILRRARARLEEAKREANKDSMFTS